MPEKETYTLAEAAQILGVSRATLQRHADTGKVPAIKLNRRVLIPRAYVDQLFAETGYPRREAAEVTA
jgi:excisionase family DNA binding protein